MGAEAALAAFIQSENDDDGNGNRLYRFSGPVQLGVGARFNRFCVEWKRVRSGLTQGCIWTLILAGIVGALPRRERRLGCELGASVTSTRNRLSCIPAATKKLLHPIARVGDVPRKATSKEFKFVDLFAGIGGTRLGFESAGGDCVFTAEWDRFARQTYEANFKDSGSHTFETDITKVALKTSLIMTCSSQASPASRSASLE